MVPLILLFLLLLRRDRAVVVGGQFIFRMKYVVEVVLMFGIFLRRFLSSQSFRQLEPFVELVEIRWETNAILESIKQAAPWS